MQPAEIEQTTPTPLIREPFEYTSELNFPGSGVRIQVSIRSKFNKAHRRSVLQLIAAALKPELEFLGDYRIQHDDSSRLNALNDGLRRWSYRQALKIDTTQAELGFLIRQKRTALGHSQKSFATLLGIERSRLSRIEHGRVSPSVELLGLIYSVYEAGITVNRSPETFAFSPKNIPSAGQKRWWVASKRLAREIRPTLH